MDMNMIKLIFDYIYQRSIIFGIIVAAIPNTTERIVIKAKADIAPAKIIKRGCRIAIIAAIKNVLSPSSFATQGSPQLNTSSQVSLPVTWCVNEPIASFSWNFKNVNLDDFLEGIIRDLFLFSCTQLVL
uniref:Uncharacterized protein n=1 Tax=Glossina austeni TaxID=7395 RepID=A0A1A9V715_GLOAU